MKVLVVDAYDRRRKILAIVLEALGCEVMETRTPLEAIDAIERGGALDKAILAPQLGSVSGADFLGFAANEFPLLECTVLTERWEFADLAAAVLPPSTMSVLH